MARNLAREACGGGCLPSSSSSEVNNGRVVVDPRHPPTRAAPRHAAFGPSFSAQVTAGSKVLVELYGWDAPIGIGLTAAIIVSYCYAGGVRASVWTDCAQGPVMMLGMAWLTGMALWEVGGPAELWRQLEAQVPGHLALLDDGAWAVLALVGFTVSGMGIIGQPHVVSRSFIIDDAENLKQARNWYFAYGLLLYAATVVVGLCARILLPPETVTDAELTLLVLAGELLPAGVVGVMVACVFAAVISTVDSMVIVQSSVVVNDLLPGRRHARWVPKLVTIVAMAIAVLFCFVEDSVYVMVMLAWPVLACGVGPIVILRAFDFDLPTPHTLGLVGLGLGTLWIWGGFGKAEVFGGWPLWNLLALDGVVTGMAPAFLLPLAVAWGLWRKHRRAAGEVARRE